MSSSKVPDFSSNLVQKYNSLTPSEQTDLKNQISKEDLQVLQAVLKGAHPLDSEMETLSGRIDSLISKGSLKSSEEPPTYDKSQEEDNFGSFKSGFDRFQPKDLRTEVSAPVYLDPEFEKADSLVQGFGNNILGRPLSEATENDLYNRVLSALKFRTGKNPEVLGETTAAQIKEIAIAKREFSEALKMIDDLEKGAHFESRDAYIGYQNHIESKLDAMLKQFASSRNPQVVGNVALIYYNKDRLVDIQLKRDNNLSPQERTKLEQEQTAYRAKAIGWAQVGYKMGDKSSLTTLILTSQLYGKWEGADNWQKSFHQGKRWSDLALDTRNLPTTVYSYASNFYNQALLSRLNQYEEAFKDLKPGQFPPNAVKDLQNLLGRSIDGLSKGDLGETGKDLYILYSHGYAAAGSVLLRMVKPITPENMDKLTASNLSQSLSIEKPPSPLALQFLFHAAMANDPPGAIDSLKRYAKNYPKVIDPTLVDLFEEDINSGVSPHKTGMSPPDYWMGNPIVKAAYNGYMGMQRELTNHPLIGEMN